MLEDTSAWDGSAPPPVGAQVRHPTGVGIVLLPPDINGVVIVESSEGEYKRVAASACSPAILEDG